MTECATCRQEAEPAYCASGGAQRGDGPVPADALRSHRYCAPPGLAGQRGASQMRCSAPSVESVIP
ncbi:hypothetical protein GCM10010388_01250 [Streptomyces mauvecolor]